MKFWDSSAIVPLLASEDHSAALRELHAEHPRLVVWAATGVEVASAIWRRSRAGELTDDARNQALRMLADLEASWAKVVEVAAVYGRARRLLATHPLRAADACQLASALHASRERPSAFTFVCLDDRLVEAARKEGFTIEPS